MSRLTGKVAIVTGASKGIGAGIAKALAAEGAAVVVNYASSKDGAERVVAAITAEGGRAIPVQGDMAKSADVRRLFAETKKAFGALDVLVNNAAVFQFDPIEAVTEDEFVAAWHPLLGLRRRAAMKFHREFDTNVLGPILTIQESLKYFGPVGGSVINVSSVASTNPLPASTVYAATKSALDSVTRVLSRELGARRIRVNSINPGLTKTEGASQTEIFGSPLETDTVSRTPLGRVGAPEDIAPAVVFLASESSAWVTGETIRVSGGLQ